MFPMLRALKHLQRFGGSVDRSYSPNSSAKVSSANFALTAFSEVRYSQATPSNSKDSSFRGYALRA
jgi:hypothetical protein